MVTRHPILTKSVTDEQARQHTEARIGELMACVVPRERRKPEQEKASAASKARPKSKPDEPRPEPHPVTDALKLYLRAILDHPNDTVTQRQRRLGWSSYKANKTKQNAVEQGHAVELSINLGRKTRGRILLLLLTSKGYDLLDLPAPDTPGYRMSPEHWWWQQAIAVFHADTHGTKAEIEFQLNGKRMDVGIIRGERIDAVEVEMTPDNAIRNAKADLEAGASHVTIACRDKQVEKTVGEYLAQSVGASALSRITLTTLADLPVAAALFGKTRRQDKCRTSVKNAPNLLLPLEDTKDG